MNLFPTDASYDELAADVLTQVRDMECGKHHGPGVVVEIAKLSNHYWVRLQLGYCQFTFFYTHAQFEEGATA